MAEHIIVDPITRIEGHLRIEAILDDNNVVREAYSSSTMFRAMEVIMKDRDPRDCGLYAMRICGVCTGTHYQRSIEAVENAFDITIPKNARIVRNLIQGSLILHDHTVHFYLLSALDFVDILSALEADSSDAVKEAQKYSDNPYNSSAGHYDAVKTKLNNYIKQGRLGIFANAYWGSKGYKFTPAQNLVALSHYLDLLVFQKEIAKLHALFGAKSPHPQSLVVGGVTCVQDIENPSRIAQFKTILLQIKDFVERAYLPDVMMAGTAYSKEALAGIGGGLGNYMAYGGFRLDDTGFYDSKLFIPSGLVHGKDLTKVISFDQSKVVEDIKHSWYKGGDGQHPYVGTTIPEYTGFNKKEDGYSYLKTDGKYSWIKSPVYDDTRVEVGPLARMIVGVANGDPNITKHVTSFLTKAGLPTKVLFSTVGRTAARAIETSLFAEAMVEWIDELGANAASGDLSTWTSYDFEKVSKETEGHGLSEAPRGALGHWIRIKDGKVANYQCVVPSTWNAAPRDSKGRVGAYESSLVGVQLSDSKQPLEIIRTIHSFDPCIACAVHVIDTKGRELGDYKVNPAGH